MEKKFIKTLDIQIAYLEQNPLADKTIFFIPGNSISSSTWRKQLKDPLFDSFRLIAFDLPAHGDSGEAADPIHTYNLLKLGEIMALSLIQLLNGGPFIIAGVSLGTNIVTEMLGTQIFPEGIILISPSIVGESITIDQFVKPNTHVHVVFTDEPSFSDVEAYARETSFANEEDIQIFLEDYKTVKGAFRSSLGQSIGAQKYSDELKLLQQQDIPLLIVFGEGEKIVDNSYLDNVSLPLWNNKIYSIPAAGHLLQIDQPEKFNQLLKEFVEYIFK